LPNSVPVLTLAVEYPELLGAPVRHDDHVFTDNGQIYDARERILACPVYHADLEIVFAYDAVSGRSNPGQVVRDDPQTGGIHHKRLRHTHFCA
jgi:hypothetical protein